MGQSSTGVLHFSKKLFLRANACDKLFDDDGKFTTRISPCQRHIHSLMNGYEHTSDTEVCSLAINMLE